VSRVTGLAHSAICVPDVEEAARWYCDVLGLTVLSPPYLMDGDAIARDMGELVPEPPVPVQESVAMTTEICTGTSRRGQAQAWWEMPMPSMAVAQKP
jgi:catechol 2,3-dioxygenase-like lactoylglutathione lyase family enzyme